MSRVVVSTHLMLDGVMQAPGPPDEGTRGIVEHSGRDGPMEIICGRSRRRNDGPCRDAFPGSHDVRGPSRVLADSAGGVPAHDGSAETERDGEE